jgi:hypothetical protein
MDQKSLSFSSSRRAFLKSSLPAGTLLCLGCGGLFAQEKAQAQPKELHRNGAGFLLLKKGGRCAVISMS